MRTQGWVTSQVSGKPWLPGQQAILAIRFPGFSKVGLLYRNTKKEEEAAWNTFIMANHREQWFDSAQVASQGIKEETTP